MTSPKHTCTEHTTPSESCYTHHGCRCTDCLTDRRRNQKRRRHLGGATVPAEQAAARLTQLLTTSSITEISSATGVARSTLLRIATGDVHRIYRRTHTAICNLATPRIHSTAGTKRRLDALRANGWTLTEISRRAGYSDGWAYTLYQRGRVLPATATLVAALYDQLWSQAPPTDTWGDRINRGRIRAMAVRHGWAPPAAWDDSHTGPHGIDNPDATPNPWRRQPPGQRRLIDPADLIEAAEQGASLAELITRFPIKPDSIDRALRRHGRPDLANHIHAPGRAAA